MKDKSILFTPVAVGSVEIPNRFVRSATHDFMAADDGSVTDILKGIRSLLGRDYPVIIKLNATDFLAGGLDIAESTEIAKILEKEGVDGIEVSGGMTEAGKIDLISVCRPFIRDPFLVKKFRTGEAKRSDCISCNKCLNPRGIRCAEKEAKD